MEPANEILSTETIRAGNHPEGAGRRDDALNKACREFEGLLLGIILKQSIKPGILNDEESKNNDAYREFAIEQTARALGESETLGISKLLRQQMIK